MAENSFRPIAPQEVFRYRQTYSQNISVVPPAYNEEVFTGNVVLLDRRCADGDVIDDDSLDRTAEIAAKQELR